MKNIKNNNLLDPVQCMWGLLCSQSSIDQRLNNISLFNVIQQINLPTVFYDQLKKEKKPLALQFPHEIVLCWKRTLPSGISEAEILADLKIKTIDPHGAVIQEIAAPFAFSYGKQRFYYRVEIPVFIVSVSGNYVHEIEIKFPEKDIFKKVFGIPFEITHTGLS
jgi:hypothetical protein